jgi:hypothetical protein
MYTRTSNVERRGAQTVHATKFVESYFDAWNHCDPQGVADHLTADGIYVDVPEPSFLAATSCSGTCSPAETQLRFNIALAQWIRRRPFTAAPSS